MDIRRHIIHPGGVWERFSLYLKQGGHAAVHREVARSLRLRTRDVVLDLGGGGHALAQLALYAGTVHGVDTSAAAVWAAISRNRHDVARGRVHVCRGTLPALPFPEAMFHVITVRARVLGRGPARLPARGPAPAAPRRPVRAGVRGRPGKRRSRTGRTHGGDAQRPGGQGRAAVSAAPAFAGQGPRAPALAAARLRSVPSRAPGRVPGGLGPGLLACADMSRSLAGEGPLIFAAVSVTRLRR